MAFISKNPATDEVLAQFDELSDEQLEQKLQTAQTAFESWRTTDFATRSKLMKALGQVFRDKASDFGKLVTVEMGRPIAKSIAELEKCATCCDYYADNAETFLKEEVVETNASKSSVRYEPLGVVLAVMPWNFPFWQVIRFAAPAIMAGNVGVLKHASNVPQCAAALEEAFIVAGFPAGIFQNLFLSSGRVGGVIKDVRIKAVTLTGSEAAGRKVASVAADNVKKAVLELGGSDPFIILEDANIDEAASVAATARLQNAGQSCIAAKRFIVTQSVADQFIEKFKAAFAAQKVGDPLDEATTVGPVVSVQAIEELQRQIDESVAKGAQVIIGGKRIDGVGSFFAPTILTNVVSGMPAYHEELFGPVASVITVADEDEALRVANDTAFGLGASVWTNDELLIQKFVNGVEAGAVFVNGMVVSDPRLPFGGLKRSGYGRELSHHGIREFVNVKTVWIK